MFVNPVPVARILHIVKFATAEVQVEAADPDMYQGELRFEYQHSQGDGGIVNLLTKIYGDILYKILTYPPFTSNFPSYSTR